MVRKLSADRPSYLLLILILAACPAPAASPSWIWGGDLRVRAQGDSQDPNDSRWSPVLRARLGFKAQLEENLRAELRLATAKNARSPNQTLGDNKEPGSPRRPVGVDLAYAEWQSTPFLTAMAGRIPQIHERPGDSQILLDADLALEGAAIKVAQAVTDEWSFFGSAGSTWVRENYDSYYTEKLTDNMIHWGQIGAQWKTSDWQLRTGGGFFNYVAFQKKNFADLSVGGTAAGNSENPAGVAKNLYVPRQLFIDLQRRVDVWDIGVFAERISNEETFDAHEALWAGFRVKRGSWLGQLAYGSLDSDAVPALFTNSDFAGGQTNSRGMVLTTRWAFQKNFTAALSQYQCDIQGLTDRLRFSRTQVDLLAAF